jgi:hypothetical protein
MRPWCPPFSHAETSPNRGSKAEPQHRSRGATVKVTPMPRMCAVSQRCMDRGSRSQTQRLSWIESRRWHRPQPRAPHLASHSRPFGAEARLLSELRGALLDKRPIGPLHGGGRSHARTRLPLSRANCVPMTIVHTACVKTSNKKSSPMRVASPSSGWQRISGAIAASLVRFLCIRFSSN